MSKPEIEVGTSGGIGCAVAVVAICATIAFTTYLSSRSNDLKQCVGADREFVKGDCVRRAK